MNQLMMNISTLLIVVACGAFISLRFSKSLRWISVAAVAVLFFGVYFGNTFSGTGGEINDPELAYLETKKALNLIAQNLNKGTEKMVYLNEYEETKNKIFIND